MLILKLHQMRKQAWPDIPSATVGICQLDSLQAEIQTDASLWLEVLRTKLDYFYSQDDIENLSHLSQEWKTLESALLQLEPNGRVWPPAVLDAVAWGKWLLYAGEFDLEQARQVLLDMLHNALDRTLPDLAIHDEIAFHIAEVKEGLPKTLVCYTL